MQLMVWDLLTDTILADFASEAGGGSLISTPETQPFHADDPGGISFLGIPIWKPNYYSPRKVIQVCLWLHSVSPDDIVVKKLYYCYS